MNRIFKTVSLGAVLAVTAATALVATPASAQSWHGGYGRGGYGAGAAVAAGVVGLAVGAAIADQGYAQPVGYAPYGGPDCYEAYPGYDGVCYPVEDYYRAGWSWRDGAWWNGSGQHFARPFMGGAPRGGYGGNYGGGHGGGFQGHGGGFGGGHGGGGGRR